MLNFETMGKRYRERVQYHAEDLIDRLVYDHLLKGGEFDAQKITKFFGTAVRIAQLITDLEIGTGLNPIEEEKDEVGDLRKGNPEGPTGGQRDEVGVCDPVSGSDTPDDNGPAGSGEVNAAEQQPAPPESGPGTGWGHSGGPTGS